MNIHAIDLCMDYEEEIETVLNSWGSVNIFTFEEDLKRWKCYSLGEQEQSIDLKNSRSVVLEFRTVKELFRTGFDKKGKAYTFKTLLEMADFLATYKALRLAFYKGGKLKLQQVMTRTEECIQEFSTTNYDKLKMKMFLADEKLVVISSDDETDSDQDSEKTTA